MHAADLQSRETRLLDLAFRRGGVVVGFATLVPSRAGVAELDALFTDPEALRTGVGRALLEDLVARAPTRAIEVTANPRALDFYAATGFEDIGLATTEFGPARRMRLRGRG